MELTIKSRKLNRVITFYRQDSKEKTYIYVNLNGSPNRKGYMGKQICKGGYITGITLKADETNFKKVCKSWLKQYYKIISYYL